MTNSYFGNSWYPLKNIAEARGLDPDYLQSIKYELDKHLYYYGNHFKHPYENSKLSSEVNVELELTQLEKISEVVITHPGWDEYFNTSSSNPIVVCNAYFSWKERLADAGFQVCLPLWEADQLGREIEQLLRYQCSLIQRLFKSNFQTLLSTRFKSALDQVEVSLKRYYSHPQVIALVIPYQLTYFEYILNRFFREEKRPTFLAIHGLCHSYALWNASKVFPYNAEKYLTDYYLVWGEGIADQFPKSGTERSQVLVTGHPDYDDCTATDLKFSLDQVLVCTKSMPGAPIMNLPIYQNRVLLIDYTYQVQTVLQKLGVNNARLRIHPSESPEWYKQYVDLNFYKLDERPLDESLDQSSLVIGPASTVFIESLFKGVNYTVFDPFQEFGFFDFLESDPPFDGSDPKVPLAKSQCELEAILKSCRIVDKTFLQDIIKTPFDISPMLQILNCYSQQKMLPLTEDNQRLLNRPLSDADNLILSSIKNYLNCGVENFSPVLKATERVQETLVEGSILDYGSEQGGEMMAACLKLIEMGSPKRNVELFKASNQVYSNVAATTYSKDNIRILENHDIKSSPSEVALLCINKIDLQFKSFFAEVYPRMAENAVILVSGNPRVSFATLKETLAELEIELPFWEFEASLSPQSWFSIKK